MFMTPSGTERRFQGTSRAFVPGPMWAAAFTLACLVAMPCRAAPDSSLDLVLDLQDDEARVRRQARTKLLKGNDPSLLPAIIDSLFFTASERRDETLEVLRMLSGEDAGSRYYDWVEWLGAHPEVEPNAGYAGFKAQLFSRIDPGYARVLDPDQATMIRREEIVWGGVKIGGIPIVDSPAIIAAPEASYLQADELVFGASVHGEHRAYPLRILDWHEMLSDTLGGEPVTLSYCTLCRSGILYLSRRPDGRAYEFGTSGLLYRSNKLMIDQETLSLWSNLTGEPVVGPLAETPAERRLEVLPMTLIPWNAWLKAHPETTTLALAPLQARYSFDYVPGAADRARSGVSFPVWRKDQRLDRNAEVYALRIEGVAKAYEVEALRSMGTLNDTVGSVPVLLVADPDSGAIRAFDRSTHRFELREDHLLESQDGSLWRRDEAALVPVDPTSTSLLRRPGHLTFWFGWYGFFPQTELWKGRSSS